MAILRCCLQLGLASVALPIMIYHNSEKTVPAICKCLQDLDSLSQSDTFTIQTIYFASDRDKPLLDVQKLLARLV